MVAKRVSTKTTTKRKAAAIPTLTDSAVITPNVRRQLVEAEAYFLAERRGFVAGHELEDWVAAEMAVDSRLQQMQAR